MQLPSAARKGRHESRAVGVHAERQPGHWLTEESAVLGFGGTVLSFENMVHGF